MELVIPEMVARHRNQSGDGTHAQLLGILDLLVSLWRNYTAGTLPPMTARSWSPVEKITAGWQPWNELKRILSAIGSYYARAL
jgi:hypothetical protein